MVVSVNTKYSFPEFLYHGTQFQHVGSLREQLLNQRFWGVEKDFGPAFYTTIDLNQAKQWANMGAARRSGLPTVLKLKFHGNQELLSRLNIMHFVGENQHWADHILACRMQDRDFVEATPGYYDIIIGPMADGSVGQAIGAYKRAHRNKAQFFVDICRNNHGTTKQGLGLGNQIAFTKESLAPLLSVAGYYVGVQGGWTYVDGNR